MGEIPIHFISRKKMVHYFMTEKEQQFLNVAHIDKNEWHGWGNGLDPAYVYFDFIDLTEAGMPIMQAKGLLSSLLEKKIVEVIEAYADMNVFNRGQYLYSFTEEFCRWVVAGGDYTKKAEAV